MASGDEKTCEMRGRFGVHRRRSDILLTTLIVMTLLVIATWRFGRFTVEPANVSIEKSASQADSSEPWPPFVMTIREINRRPNSSGTWLYRFEYRSQRVWCSSELETTLAGKSNGRPDMSCDDRQKIADTTASDAPYQVPIYWLRPFGVPFWLNDNAEYGGVGLATVVREQFAKDATGATIEVYREELTYRRMDGIPVRWVVLSNGRELERADILDLQVFTRQVQR